MKSQWSYYGLILSLLISFPAQAMSADISIANTILASMTAASGNLMSQAMIWLGVFMALQFTITNLGLLKSGADIEAVIGKLIGSLMWFGICVYVLENGPAFIDSVGTGILNKFASNIPTPGSLLASTLSLCTLILAGIVATGSSIAGFGNSSLGMTLVYILFIVFSVGMLLAIKVFMLTLELGLVVLLSPLSFSFLGLNALKDQGIAPFKSLISLVYRIILLGIVCAAADNIFALTETSIKSFSFSDPTKWGDVIEAFFSAIFAFPFLGYLAHKSDSIAASLSSGSTNLGAADIAGAAAAGAAAGAVAAGAGAAIAGTKPTAMSEVISKMMGGGSASNANPMGSMSNITPPPPKPSSSASLSGGGNGNQYPARPAPVEGEGSPAAGDSSPPPSPASSGSSSPAPASPSQAGNATTAGIGGGNADLAKAVGDLVQSMNQPKKATFGERLGNANRHVEQEKAATHVSINTHQPD
jgi:type IV secretion system protein TrbL